MFKNRITVLAMSLLMTFSLVSCGGNGGFSQDNNPPVNMTESYKKARDEFKAVTGVELPELENLEVDEFPYEEGMTDYCFDIVSGSALNYATYQTFESFFLEKFGECDSGFPDGDEENGRDAQWTTESERWFETYWDSTNKAVYINTRIISLK